MSELNRAAGLAYREARPADWQEGGPTALLVHGWPESSYMWRAQLDAIAGAGWRALAPDLPGYGDTPPDPPGTWERHMEALQRFYEALDLPSVALVVHDWGVLIGLRWACDHPQSARALVVSDGGFFADRRWHDLANLLRTPGEGEKFIDGFTREAFDAALHAASPGMSDDALDEYWKAFSTPEGRRGALELYRSGDFEKLAPYEGRLTDLNLPALIVWGEQDRFAGVAMAQRFHEQLPGSRLEVLPAAGHFVWEDDPDTTAALVSDFLRALA